MFESVLPVLTNNIVMILIVLGILVLIYIIYKLSTRNKVSASGLERRLVNLKAKLEQMQKDKIKREQTNQSVGK